MAARSVASTSRSGPRCSGGSTKLRVIGTVMASSGSSSSGPAVHVVLERQQGARLGLDAQHHVERPAARVVRVQVDLPGLAVGVRLHEVPVAVDVEAVLGHMLLEVGDETVQIDQRHADPLLCWILIPATACHDLGHDETVSRSGGIYTI